MAAPHRLTLLPSAAVLTAAMLLGTPNTALAAGNGKAKPKPTPVLVTVVDVQLRPHINKLLALFDVTANQAIKEAAVVLKTRCSFEGKVQNGRGSAGLEDMKPGDTERKTGKLLDIEPTGAPEWCDFVVSFSKDQLSDGKPLATVCWKDGQVTDGKCAK